MSYIIFDVFAQAPRPRHCEPLIYLEFWFVICGVAIQISAISICVLNSYPLITYRSCAAGLAALTKEVFSNWCANVKIYLMKRSGCTTILPICTLGAVEAELGT